MSIEHVSSILPAAINLIKTRSQEHTMKLTDQEVIAQQNDAEMMRRSHLWQSSRLPLKRRKPEGGLPQIAVLEVAVDRSGFVLRENMSIMGTSFGEDVTSHHYADPEAILMDGWVVD